MSLAFIVVWHLFLVVSITCREIAISAGPRQPAMSLLFLNASEFVADALRGAFISSRIDNYTEVVEAMEQPTAWETWGVGLAVISACSFSAPLGMLILPCLSKSLYDRVMTFLIAVGIGALSGSTMFVMVPQAFHLTELDDFDYMVESWTIICALYVFFTVDRILQYILEFRRRLQAKHKVHISTVEKMMNRNDEPENEEEKKEIDGIKNELEVTMLNNALSRAFSTRRNVAVVRMDDMECVSPRLTPSPSRKVSISSHDNNDFLSNVNRDIHYLAYPRSPLQAKKSLDVNTVIGNGVCNGTTKIGEKASSSTIAALPSPTDKVSVSIQAVEKHVFDATKAEVASVAYMIIFGSSANNFVDGMSMGAAFSDSVFRGLSIGVAVLSQQFPQELGTLAILINSGLGLRRTLLFNLLPTLLSFIGFSLGVLLDNVNEGYDSYIFAVSSGMYLYIFLGTLVPEIRDSVNELIKTNLRESLVVSALQTIGIAFGLSFMYHMGKIHDMDD